MSGNRQSVIDLTLATPPIAHDIEDWSVSGKDSMSDHRYITFTLKCDRKPPGFRRNPRRTNWTVYDQELNQSIGMWIGKVTTPGDIERELTNLNKAVIGSFEKACPRRRISGRKKVPWWNPELTLLKKKANRAFHVAYCTRTEDDFSIGRRGESLKK